MPIPSYEVPWVNYVYTMRIERTEKGLDLHFIGKDEEENTQPFSVLRNDDSGTPIKIELPSEDVDKQQQADDIILALIQAFLSRHGSFPLDKTNDMERQWCAAMSAAYEYVGVQELTLNWQKEQDQK